MRTRQEILAKLAKWFQRAEGCTDPSKVDKILRKAEKHAKRLAELDQMDDNWDINERRNP